MYIKKKKKKKKNLVYQRIMKKLLKILNGTTFITVNKKHFLRIKSVLEWFLKDHVTLKTFEHILK